MIPTQVNSLRGVVAVLVVIAWLLISIGTVTTGGLILGLVMALGGGIVLFYALYRLDKWAKGM